MSAAREWSAWKDSRVRKVKDPSGNLALVETRWRGNLRTDSLDGALEGQPETVQATLIERKDFDGNLVDTGIRLWDGNSPAIQAFQGIDVFPFDPKWIIKGKFVPHAEMRPVPHEFIRDNGGTRDLAVPGDIQIEIEGVNYSLNAFDDEGTLLLVFADQTNGSESYAAGRFLVVHTDPESDEITLNFNHAFVPPCGFSIHYNCPLPPPQNRIKTAIRAGEKNPLFIEGYQLH